MLNCKQKIKHLKLNTDHKQYLLTSTQYASELKICELAQGYNKLIRKSDGQEYMISPFAPVNLPLLDKLDIDVDLAEETGQEPKSQGIKQKRPYNRRVPAQENNSSEEKAGKRRKVQESEHQVDQVVPEDPLKKIQQSDNTFQDNATPLEASHAGENMAHEDAGRPQQQLDAKVNAPNQYVTVEQFIAFQEQTKQLNKKFEEMTKKVDAIL